MTAQINIRPLRAAEVGRCQAKARQGQRTVAGPYGPLRFCLPAALVCGVLLAACSGASDGAAAPEQAVSASSLPPGPSPASTPAPTPSPTPAPAAAEIAAVARCNFDHFQADLLAAVNATRAQARTCGNTTAPAVGALKWNDKLTRAALAHSTDMATTGTFSHTGSGGSTASTRVEAAGYIWRAVGENIAWNYRDVAAVMAGWISSPGHCQNLMSSNFKEMGVACVPNRAGQPYWTMDLGTPR